MEIVIESTDKLTHLDGVPCRLWSGTTADGIPCHVFVHRIAVAVADSIDHQQFARELTEQAGPAHFVPLSQIL